jgi:hypothetical protein
VATCRVDGGSSFPETLVNFYQTSWRHTAVIVLSDMFCSDAVLNTGVI